MWKDALRQKAASQAMQGPNAAGKPGMGAGPVPYAPGSTQWKASMEPPRRNMDPGTPRMPMGAGNGAQGSPGTPPPQQPAQGPPAAPQGQMGVDPYQVMAFARQLMDRYRVGYGQARRYRG
jgi:hypothetical protein